MHALQGCFQSLGSEWLNQMCLKADIFAFSKVSLPEPLTTIVWFGRLPAAAMSDRATEETFPAPDECRGVAASGNHVGFLTIFRRLLRGDTSK